ncbi:MAG: hypothetical protein MMC23_008561 [Stictis urceolatum]|nr:hypothetical protein [Stictis urceolata]
MVHIVRVASDANCLAAFSPSESKPTATECLLWSPPGSQAWLRAVGAAAGPRCRSGSKLAELGDAPPEGRENFGGKGVDASQTFTGRFAGGDPVQVCWRSVGSEQGVLLWGQVLLAVGVLLGGAIGGGGGGGAMAWLAGGAARLPVLAGTRKPSIKCSSSYISSFGVEDRHHHHYHRRQRIQRQLARQAQTLEGAAVAGREYNDPAMKGPEIEIEVVVLPVISSATMVPRSVSQDGFGLP